jgi:hypothetical protein
MAKDSVIIPIAGGAGRAGGCHHRAPVLRTLAP